MAGPKDFKAAVTWNKEAWGQFVDVAKKDVRLKAAEVIGDHCQKVAETARELCPVGPTGNLKAGIVVDHKQDSYFGRVRSTAPHSHWIAFGTARGMKPNNFLYKAADRHKDELIPALKAKFNE